MFCIPWHFSWAPVTAGRQLPDCFLCRTNPPVGQVVFGRQVHVFRLWQDVLSFRGFFGSFTFLTGFSLPTMAVESRLICPISSSDKYSFTTESCACFPSSPAANSPECSAKMPIQEIPAVVIKPHMLLRFLVAFSARMRSIVVGRRYNVFATNARAIACRSRGLRPRQCLVAELKTYFSTWTISRIETQALFLLSHWRIKTFVQMGNKLFWTRPINHDILSLSFIGIPYGFIFGGTKTIP